MEARSDFIIDWSGRALDYSDEDIAAVVDAMRHADPLTQGRYLKAFESEFAVYLGVARTFAVSNCTNALHLISRLCRLGRGDEVILPAHTFSATAIPFGSTGARLVWADVDPDTFLVSPESVEGLITERTRAIVPVHLYGLMADMDPIMELARDHGCLVVEDAAQALGAEYRGRKAGTIGDFGAFSFHGQKHITTLGEGGALSVLSEDAARLVPGLRHNGVRPFERQDEYWVPAMSDVDLDLDGVWPLNYCLGEPQCALASALLRRLDAMNQVRSRRAEKFKDALKEYPELQFQAVPPERKHAYHLLPARYQGDRATSHDFIRTMAFTHRIKVIVQYCPLYRYPLFRKMGFGDAECPNTDSFYDNMVSFPFHLWMREDEFEYMIESTIDTLELLRKGLVN